MSHGCASSFFCLYFIAILMKWHIFAFKDISCERFLCSTQVGIIGNNNMGGWMKGTQNFTRLILLWVYLCFVYKTVSIYQLIDKERWHIHGTCQKCLSYFANNIVYYMFCLMMYKRILITKKGKRFPWSLNKRCFKKCKKLIARNI